MHLVGTVAKHIRTKIILLYDSAIKKKHFIFTSKIKFTCPQLNAIQL